MKQFDKEVNALCKALLALGSIDQSDEIKEAVELIKTELYHMINCGVLFKALDVEERLRIFLRFCLAIDSRTESLV